MKKFWSSLQSFFLLPGTTHSTVRAIPYIVVVVVLLAIFAAGIAGWSYTNSNNFCGTTCHTMPPQFLTYQRSPHARVECVECHLGRDVITKQIPRKVGHSHTLIALITHSYEYPIVAKKMRPASEACETCHYPQKFSDDSLREIRSYQSDEQNTPQSIFMLLKTGGGTKRQGLGFGIHWHVENKVEFYTSDTKFEQVIPYIRVTDADGKVTEYVDIDSGVKAQDMAGQKLKTMDCITCHNRITHTILSPEQAIDNSLANKQLSDKLPYIREQSVALLSAEYPDMPSADKAFETLPDYYAKNYPDVYASSKADIDAAVALLKSINPQIRYPEQELDWNSHPNNIGHKDSAGCFRCHDGRHFTVEGKAVRLECNLCHSIPAKADPTKFVTDLAIERGPEPETHTSTSWIRLHGKAIDQTCAGCHPPLDPATDLTKLTSKPAPDGSFCGNSACHVTAWKFMGAKTGNLEALFQTQLATLVPPTPTPAPTPLPDETVAPTEAPAGVTYEGQMKAIFDTRCKACHGSGSPMAGLDLTSYDTILKGNKDGAGIVPNDSGASLIYKIQSAGGHFGQMTADELALLKAWIDAGAPK